MNLVPMINAKYCSLVNDLTQKPWEPHIKK